MSTLADRVKDLTTSTGTGAITLADSAPTGFRTFSAAFGTGSTVVNYCIDDLAGRWEVGRGTFNGTTGLTRTTVLSSSNDNALVTFVAGSKTVFCTAPATLLDTAADYRAANFVAGTDYLTPTGNAAGLSGLPTTLPASDVYTWAKAATKPSYTKSEVGLGDVPNLSYSGSNTGDETTATIKSKLSISTLSGSNTGDQTLPTLLSLGAQASGSYATLTEVETLSNKRITPRVLSAASYTTDTGTSLNCNTLDEFIVTAQAETLKFNNPTGTPTDGQCLLITVTGTAGRGLTWDTQFEASTIVLPVTTVGTSRLNMGFIWRADTSKWVCVGST
jgi:hypothetical protein